MERRIAMANRTLPALARAAPRASKQQRTLRAVVLRLGGQLGWSKQEVATFAEGVTGRPWAQCGPTEWWAVLDEYRAIIAVIAAKRARRMATETDAEEGDHGSPR